MDQTREPVLDYQKLSETVHSPTSDRVTSSNSRIPNKEITPPKKLSIIFPVFNEEDNLEALYQETVDVLKARSFDYELIFVDDGSKDRSRSIVRSLSERDPNVKALFFRRNYGQTAAMTAGVEYASGDVLLFMDADRQNDPADIPLMIDKLNEGFDVVSGWRKNRKDKAFSRKVPSKIANWIIRKIAGVPIHDLGCSLKAYRADLIKEVKLYGEMHRFIPIYVKAHGGMVTEIVVNHRPRTAGASKYGISRTFRVILDLIVVKFLMSYSTRPMHFFGGTAMWLLVACGISSMGLFYHKFINGVSMIRSPLLLLSAMLIILAVNMILMGILSEIQMRTYYESQDKKSFTIAEKLGL